MRRVAVNPTPIASRPSSRGAACTTTAPRATDAPLAAARKAARFFIRSIGGVDELTASHANFSHREKGGTRAARRGGDEGLRRWGFAGSAVTPHSPAALRARAPPFPYGRGVSS